MQRKVGGQWVSLGVRERAGSGFWEILRCDESDGTIVCFRAMWKGACERKEHAKTLVVAAGDALFCYFCYFPYYLDASA